MKRVVPIGSSFVCYSLLVRVSQGFWGTREHWQNIEGNKGTLANFWEREQNLKIYSTKTFGKCVGTWKHRAILEGNKGTRTPPGRPSLVLLKTAGIRCGRYCKSFKFSLQLRFKFVSYVLR